jgi:hypothetical protein
MADTIEPLPIDAPMVDRPALTISAIWYRYLSEALLQPLQRSAYVVAVKTLPGQQAAIPPTSTGAVEGGVYRVSYVVHVTQAASGNSSLTVTIGYTDGGVNLTQSGAAMTTNTVNTVQSGVMLVRVDPATPLTYSTAYTSSGGTKMTYTISFLVEQF